jgi:predicted house-cleaning NTP pyrophosphatase (Maf/HAM1 superfamily)
MAAGRKTGGRQKGTPNRASIDRQAEVIASGLAPLDYMLQVMRDDQAPRERRDDMAKAAAPYVHPRLTSAEIKSDTTVRYVARIPDKAQSSETWQEQHAPEMPSEATH